ncbi:MAG: DUF362 domain-containing protein [Desulfobacteraceae bacterium]|nr:MAG: DUF362 domain-containing protein [Desulfobacteraceae bacterium]
MAKSLVAIVRYEKPYDSVRKAVELSGGLDKLPSKARVFIKPNLVFWTKEVVFPKWGVLTTSRVVEDMVILLKERGIDDIVIGEGIVTWEAKDKETPLHAFETLGYNTLKRRYGVKRVNVLDRPFEKVDLGEGIQLNFNQDILHSDFVVDIPVMKAHNQSVVSLAFKNLKGTLDIASRKKCHSADLQKDLNFMIARLPDKMPPIFALLDGIYTNERGPFVDGKIRRSNILVASSDILSADLVGARVLGYEAAQVPHLAYAAGNRNRPHDLSDIRIAGESIEDVAAFHEHDYKYVEDEDRVLPLPMFKQGVKGLYYRKYDLSMCTYCSAMNGLILNAIRYAWQGEPFDDVEVLTGKIMKPTAGHKKTILMGKCMVQANKNHPDIQELIAVKGCPPQPEAIVEALHKAGIPVNPVVFEKKKELPGLLMKNYEGRPEFDESFFRVKE